MAVDKHKAWLIIGIVIAVLVVGVILIYPSFSGKTVAGQAYTSGSCSDPDSSSTYDLAQVLIKSTTTYGSTSAEDLCKTKDGKLLLYERICLKNGQMSSWPYDCSKLNKLPGDNYECNDGACVNKGTPSETAKCGDNILDSGEECDDGNTNDGDGCSGACKIVCYDPDEDSTKPYKTSTASLHTKTKVVGINKTSKKYGEAIDSCFSETDVREFYCIDATTFHWVLLECGTGETCQNGACVTPVAATESSCGDETDNDGDTLTDCVDPDCAGQLNAQGKTCCLSDVACTQAGETCDLSINTCGVKVAPAVCGDGVIGSTETCDDGNKVGGDGCTENCLIGCNDPDKTYASQPYPNYLLNSVQKSSFSTKTKVSGIQVGSAAVTEYEDACSDEATIIESFCENSGSYSWNSFKCANYLPGTVCQEGACIVAVPTKETNCGDGADEDIDGLMDCDDTLDCPNNQASCGVGKYCSDTKCIFNTVEGNYNGKGKIDKEDIQAIKSNPSGFWNYAGKSVQKLNQYIKKISDGWKK